MSERSNDLFKTFYRHIDDGERQPEDSDLERDRLIVDVTFFPYYYKYVVFAALTLDGRGPESYGECSFVFKQEGIGQQSTVFEENTLVFGRKHKIGARTPPPAGYRTVWRKRHRLAAAKLHAHIDSSTEAGKFSEILLKQHGSTDADDFLEVHIYDEGKLRLEAVERFIYPEPIPRLDEILTRRLIKKLEAAGVRIGILA